MVWGAMAGVNCQLNRIYNLLRAGPLDMPVGIITVMLTDER